MAFDDPFNAGAENMGDIPSNNFYNFNDEDPAAEFLEREKRELADITGDSNIDSYTDPFNTQSQSNNLSNSNKILIFFSM